MQNDEALGIYSLSYALCSVLLIIKGALNVSWIPFYMDYKKQGNTKEILEHSRRYIKTFTIICIGFIMLAYDVFKFIAPKNYWNGMSIIPILVLAFYFDFLYLFPVNHEFFLCKTKLIPINSIFAGLINLALNYVLIPKFGIIGASIGTLIAESLFFVFNWISVCFIINNTFEYNWKYFFIGTFFLVFFIILAIILKDVIWARWFIAGAFGIYLFIDIIKKKSIF